MLINKNFISKSGDRRFYTSGENDINLLCMFCLIYYVYRRKRTKRFRRVNYPIKAVNGSFYNCYRFEFTSHLNRKAHIFNIGKFIMPSLDFKFYGEYSGTVFNYGSEWKTKWKQNNYVV